LTTTHPEWVLGGANGGLLNFGNPQVKQWAIEHFDKLIKEQGVDLYREDFNIDPLGYWRGNDAPDRQGITENLDVQAHLAYWDELRRRHPDMLIDTCASGGRRNDLESLRRAVPLLRSDFHGAGDPGSVVRHAANQAHTYGLSLWVPYFGTGEYYNNGYSVRGHFCQGMGIGYNPALMPVDWKRLKKTIADWQAVVPEFYGDYYPLTTYSLSEDVWMAWQFNRPENGTGMVQAFRRMQSRYQSIRVKLQGLDKDAVYTLTNLDLPGTTKMTGRDLSEKGLAITIQEQPGAAIIAYKKRP
jgi:alpha-galactosidase